MMLSARSKPESFVPRKDTFVRSEETILEEVALTSEKEALSNTEPENTESVIEDLSKDAYLQTESMMKSFLILHPGSLMPVSLEDLNVTDERKHPERSAAERSQPSKTTSEKAPPQNDTSWKSEDVITDDLMMQP